MSYCNCKTWAKNLPTETNSDLKTKQKGRSKSFNVHYDLKETESWGKDRVKDEVSRILEGRCWILRVDDSSPSSENFLSNDLTQEEVVYAEDLDLQFLFFSSTGLYRLEEVSFSGFVHLYGFLWDYSLWDLSWT